jgi:hypothetical protein
VKEGRTNPARPRMYTGSAREMATRKLIRPAYPLHAWRQNASWGRRHWSQLPSWGTNAEAGKMSPVRRGRPLALGGSGSRLDEVRIGRRRRRDATHRSRWFRASGWQRRQSTWKRASEGGGRPAQAAHRSTGAGDTRGTRVRTNGEETDLRGGTAEGGSDVTGTQARWLSRNKHIGDAGEKYAPEVKWVGRLKAMHIDKGSNITGSRRIGYMWS